MSVWEAILLGLIQGLTEFLPISSSGHLVLTNFLLGVNNPTIVFEIAVHLGTLVAVLVYFRKDLIKVIIDFFKGGSGRNTGWMIILATIPTALIGFGFKDLFESIFHAPRYAAIGLILTSLILFSSEKARSGKSELANIKWWQALTIGLFQGLAIMPGISRSGSTIAAGLISGLERSTAARFSFLLSIPAILGAALLNIKDFMDIPSSLVVPSLFGVVVSAISGYAAIGLLMAILRKGRLYGFVVYTLIVGIIGVILLPS